jgi:flagellar biosynthesis/type III secretory pathway protein FliH
MSQSTRESIELVPSKKSSSQSFTSSVASSREIIRVARKEAKEILAEANRQVARKIKESAELGFIEARDSVIADVAELELLYTSSRERIQSEILRVALTLAEELIGISIEMYPDALAKRVEEALSLFPNPTPLQIYVSKTEVVGMEASMKHLRDVRLPSLQYEVRADPKLSRGSARIKTNHISIELDMQEHLAQLKERLNDCSK